MEVCVHLLTPHFVQGWIIAVVDETVKTSEAAADGTESVSNDPAQVVDEVRAAEETTAGPSEGLSATSDAESVVEESAYGNADELVDQPGTETESAETEMVETESDNDVDGGKDVPPIESIEEDSEDSSKEKDWYILKVQVNRESSICDALRRRVKVEGLEDYFGEILVPTEDVREFTKTGKQRVVKRKLYPGYIVVHMAINDDTWFAVRETPGIGDFTGSAGKPTPMLQHEIERILKAAKPDEDDDKEIKTTIKFKQGDRVRVKEGHFENFEGEIDTVDETHGRVTVMINIFGRPTPVELEHWQVEDV